MIIKSDECWLVDIIWISTKGYSSLRAFFITEPENPYYPKYVYNIINVA